MWAVSLLRWAVSKRIVPKPDLLRSLTSINRVPGADPRSTTEVSPEEQALSSVRASTPQATPRQAASRCVPDRTEAKEESQTMKSAPRYLGGYWDVDCIVAASCDAVAFA